LVRFAFIPASTFRRRRCEGCAVPVSTTTGSRVSGSAARASVTAAFKAKAAHPAANSSLLFILILVLRLSLNAPSRGAVEEDS
jgi:hypothetical protein